MMQGRALEITVVLADDERRYRQKFLVYETVVMDENDPSIKECLRAAKENFEGEPEDIQIRALLVVQ